MTGTPTKTVGPLTPTGSPFPSRSGRRSMRREVFLAAIGLILISAVLTVAALTYLRQQTIEAGVHLTETFAQVIEEQTSRTLEAVDQRLVLAATRLNHLQASGGLDGASGNALIRRELMDSPIVVAMMVLDSRGRVAFTSEEEEVGIDLSGRDTFTAHLGPGSPGLFVGLAERQPATGQWSLQASRAIRSPAGALERVMVAQILSGHFEETWKRVSMGEADAIVLLRGDGIMLMRSPFDGSKVGQSFANGPVFQASRGHSEGTLRDAEMGDDVPRAFAYRTLSVLPGAVIVVGASYEVILVAWREAMQLAVGLWIGGALSILILCLILLAAWRRGLRSETEVQQMAERLTLATDTALIGVWDWTPKTGHFYATPTYFTMMGADPNDAQVAHEENWAERFHPDDRQRVASAAGAVVTGAEDRYRYEGRLRHEDGTYRWISAVGRLVGREPDGSASRVIGIRVDITDLKRAEEDLRKARDLFRSVVQHVPAGIFWKDRESRYLGCNDHFAEHAGCKSPEGVIGRTDSEMPWKDRAEWYRSQDHEVMESGVALLDQEHEGLHPDGRGALLSTSKVPLRNERDEVVGLLGIQRDITETRRAQDALKDSEARNRTLIQWLPHGITVHRDGKLVFVNPAMARMVGAPTPQELVGRSILDFLRTDFHEFAGSRVRDLEGGGGVTPASTVTCLRLDGSEFEAEVQGTRIVFGGSEAIFSYVTDISARNAADLAIRNSLHEKEALLKEVHHRVKNNLQVITSLLRLEAGRTAQPDTKAVLATMQARIQSMALLHETLYRSGTFASVDLGAYLKQLAGQSFRAQSAQAGRVQLELDLASARVEMDQAIPCGLLVNELISNALKHAFPDGRHGEVRVQLASAHGGSHLRLRVSNNGVGLASDFDTRRGQSLGLQLVGDLARQLGGTLEIGAGPDVSFTLTFPAGDLLNG